MSQEQELSPERFGDLCIQAYKKAKPDWVPPHDTIFNVARKNRTVAIINKMTEEKWAKVKAANADDDVDEKLRIEVHGVGVVTLKWTDLQTLVKGR